MNPRELRCSSSCCSSNSPWRMRRNTRTMPISTIRLRMPIRNRNVPEMVGPIRPVAWCSAESSFATLPLSPLMPSGEPDREQEDDARVAEREEEPHAQRPLAVAHQLARRVVDRADVVGVEGVAHPERVGRDADPDAEDAASQSQVLRRDEAEQQAEADDVEGNDHEGEPGSAPPLGRRERARDADPSRDFCRQRRYCHRTVPPGSCPGRLTASGSQERISRIRPPPRTHSSDPAGRFDGGEAGPVSRCEASGSGRLVRGVRR